MKLHVVFLAIWCCLCLSSHAQQTSEEVLSDLRVETIAQGLRCIECQNQTVAESDSQLAEDMRTFIRRRIEEGDSDTEIRSFMTERYGDYILMKPAWHARTWALWGLPIGAIFLLALVFFRMTQPQKDRS